MISFFRRVREKLLGEGNIRRYLLYAVGEIALVMIGILLALQVNNWNEERKRQQQEDSILRGLQLEVNSNRKITSACTEQHIERLAKIDTLKLYVGPEYAALDKDRLNHMIGWTGSSYRCQIETDILEELRSSGNLNVIRNKDLRLAISKWSAFYQELKEEEQNWETFFSDKYLPYMNDKISWADVDALLQKNGNQTYVMYEFDESKFDYDANTLLQEFEFENHLNNLHWRIRRVRLRLDSTYVQTGVVDSLIALQLK